MKRVVSRPALCYHGGKWRVAPWIISLMPPHRLYIEPYGGGASVLLRKARAYAEIYNDMEGEVVNLFRVLRDHSASLIRALELTPFAREEYRAAFAATEDPVELARRLVVRSYMGFGSNSVNRLVNSGFRANSNRNGTTPAHDWAAFPPAVAAIAARLRGVVIEHRPALELLATHRSPDTLYYLDPPYVHSTRTKGAGQRSRPGYIHEMSDEDHISLAAVLVDHPAKIMISGYRCDLYDALYAGWHREERAAMADGARARIECLWLNRAAMVNVPLLMPDSDVAPRLQAPAGTTANALCAEVLA